MKRTADNKPIRSGFTILEVVIAGALLAAVLIVSARLVWNIARQRELILDRQTALAEAGNVMERLFARPWDELSGESVDDLRLSPLAERALTGGGLSIDVSDVPEEPDAKRILVRVTWSHDPAQPERSVQLAAVRYATETFPGRRSDEK